MADIERKKTHSRAIMVREEEYTYLCEWEQCNTLSLTMKNFLLHLSAHIAEFCVNTKQQNANTFYCKWCECGCQIFGNYGDFERHVYFHAFHARLKCFGQLLLHKSESPPCLMDAHSRNWIPELPERLHCGWDSCGFTLDNPVLFYGHVNQHIDSFPDGNDVKGGCPCSWETCNSTFKSKYKLREHVRSHTQEKVVACPTCGGLFSNRTKLFDHIKRQKEITIDLHQCNHCNKKFASDRLLRDHMRHHVNHYKCPFCDMTCPAPSSLRNHIKYRHSEEKPFRCAHCDHRSKSSSDLRRHMENHSDQSFYACHVEGCDFQARCYWSIANHTKKAHTSNDTRTYYCHLCHKKFTRGSLLTRHLKKNHKFKWPSGHSRFQYKLDTDGFWRLQTVRFESIDISNHPDNRNPGAMESETGADGKIDCKDNTAVKIVVKDVGVSKFNPSCNLEMLGDVALNGQTLTGPVISISEQSNSSIRNYEGSL